jgi:Domain of unknown function (DUF4365)
MTKRFNPKRKPANQGVAYVQGIVDEMDCVWRPTPNDDVGLDGEIELGKDGAATARLLKVQVKSGSSYIRNPTGTSFEFFASSNDLGYWSAANLPVILVVYDPEKREGYWKPIQQYLKEHPGPLTKGRRIPFSRRKDRFVAGTFMQLCNLVFPDEAELTNFLKNKITEPLYSNLLPVLTYPENLFYFQSSESRTAEAISEEIAFPNDFVPHGNGYIGFRDPRVPGSSIASVVISNTVELEESSQYLQNPNTRSKIVGLWNEAISAYLLHLGLHQRDKSRFYFPPEKGNRSREIEWAAPRRTATRTVAYPYIGKQSQKTVFWVHHSLRTQLRNVGGEYFLKLEPGWVFTRDGSSFIQSSDAGALSTSRMSQERNYQVLNHLYFWTWFIARGTTEIRIPCGTQHLVIQPDLASGIAHFGIGTDKKTLSAISNSDYDLNWSDLEEDTREAAALSSGEE